MKLMFSRIIVMLLIGTACMVNGQNSWLWMTKNGTQNQLNTAYVPDRTFHLSFGVAAALNTGSLALNDFVKDGSDGGNYVYFGQNLDDLGAENKVMASLDLNLVDVGVKLGSFYISGGMNTRFFGMAHYTDQLIELATYGNAPYIGKTMDLSTGANTISFHEIYGGLSKKIGIFSFGVRAKYLNGIQTLYTPQRSLSLYTSDDVYQLTLATDYDVYSSSVIDYQDVENINTSFNSLKYTDLFEFNKGLGFDVGVQVDLSDKTSLFASAKDLGNISWTLRTQRLSKKGDVSFEGVDIAEYLKNQDSYVITDSLYNLLELNREDVDFKTSLPMSINIGAKHQLLDNLSLGVVAQYHKFGSSTYNSLTLQGQTSLLKWLDLGVSYSINMGRFDNLGVNIAPKLGPVRLQWFSENIFGLIAPSRFSYTNLGLQISVDF